MQHRTPRATSATRRVGVILSSAAGLRAGIRNASAMSLSLDVRARGLAGFGECVVLSAIITEHEIVWHWLCLRVRATRAGSGSYAPAYQ